MITPSIIKSILFVADILGLLASAAFWTDFWNDADKVEGHIVTLLTILSLIMTIIYKWKNKEKK